MKIVLIQVLLIAVVVVVAARLFRSGGARSQAVRRIGLLLFAAFAVFSILVPGVWNRIAHFVGVGRGTDMVLYALVVAFLSYVVTTYLRFRDFEVRYTRLARRLALDEAARDYPYGSRSSAKGAPAPDDDAAADGSPGGEVLGDGEALDHGEALDRGEVLGDGEVLGRGDVLDEPGGHGDGVGGR